MKRPPVQMPQRAMLFAAGLGKRMRPLTENCPKPLVEVAGRCLVDRALDRLEEAGVTKVVVNTHHLAALLEEHLAMRATPEIIFSHETELLETGGGIVQALPLLGEEPFFALNSDIILLNGPQLALHRLAQAWDDTLDALLLVHPVYKAVGYGGRGDFVVDGAGQLRLRREHEVAPFVFTGVQILHPRLFAGRDAAPFSLSTLYRELSAKKKDGDASRIRAIIHDGEWLHVGDVRGIRLAEQALNAM